MASTGIMQKEKKTTFCYDILQLSKEHFVSLFCNQSFNKKTENPKILSLVSLVQIQNDHLLSVEPLWHLH